ncbi:TRAP transporter small permease [Marispirochaeta aestuarii]|uniref:TRAP transporter small permease n=1 Tax=Marispirochaeta aestuarii TaxID=1963862 RepID=UPI0029C8D793|nr:TRAP transporter small permease [Marispirochaeta aestuarii]
MKRIIEGINSAILLCMFIITVITVIFRVFLGISASWSEDLAQFSFIFLVFIGSAAIMRDETHISISFLVDRVSPTLQRIMRIFTRLLILPFMYFFVVGAWRNILNNWGISLSTVRWMKIGYMYTVLFITGSIMIMYLFINLYKDIFLFKRDNENENTGGPA